MDQRTTATPEPEGRLWSILYQGAAIKTYSLSAWAEPIAICLDAFFGMSEEGVYSPMAFLPDPSSIDPVPSGLVIRFNSLRARKLRYCC